MVVEVLKPEDCLKLPYSMKHPKSSCSRPKPNRTNRAQPNRKKRSPNTAPTTRPSVGSKVPSKNHVMGQVKILKRGEDLKEMAPGMSVKFDRENVVVNSGSSIPDAGSVPTLTPLTELNNNCNRNKVDPVAFYAGFAFITSPSPSSVPIPGFFSKKISKIDDVTSDLKKILRLD